MPLAHVIIVLLLVASFAVSTIFVILIRRIRSLDERFARVSANLERMRISLERLDESHRRQLASSRVLADELLARMRDLRLRQLAQSDLNHSRETPDDTREPGGNEEFDSGRRDDSLERPMTAVEPTGLEPTSNMSDQAVEVGELILELLDADGRTSKISSIAGLTDWIKSKWDSLEAESVSEREGLWLLVVISKSNDERGIVIPALDTVIGAGVVSDWFDCRLYDGTSPLQRRHVRELAEAIRNAPGQAWRVKKRGLISRETVGEGA